VSPAMQGPAVLSLDSIIQFNWEVALGDQRLTQKELEALAKLKTPLVRIRGQWVHMSREEIEAALDFWRKKASGTVTVREVVQMALGASATPGGLALEGVAAEGWVGDVLGRLEGTTAFEELPAPGGFVGELRPYQGRGYSWLAFLRQWGMGACLADDMGLGKTIQTLALIQRDWEASPPNGGRGILPRGEAAGSRFHRPRGLSLGGLGRLCGGFEDRVFPAQRPRLRQCPLDLVGCTSQDGNQERDRRCLLPCLCSEHVACLPSRVRVAEGTAGEAHDSDGKPRRRAPDRQIRFEEGSRRAGWSGG